MFASVICFCLRAGFALGKFGEVFGPAKTMYVMENVSAETSEPRANQLEHLLRDLLDLPDHKPEHLGVFVGLIVDGRCHWPANVGT